MPITDPPTDDPLSPADALDRVVYYLDRALAPGSKAKAFQRAAEVVRETGDEQIAELAAQGRLQELAGIGPSTAKVIIQALDGDVPEYLTRIEQESVIEVDDACAALPRRAAGRLPPAFELE